MLRASAISRSFEPMEWTM
uniref:Uncharacterized protein n=1 Tax=Rhizophora mucronata TaxID=61149 RepID=A0A2P2NPY3_RHIMU